MFLIKVIFFSIKILDEIYNMNSFNYQNGPKIRPKILGLHQSNLKIEQRSLVLSKRISFQFWNHKWNLFFPFHRLCLNLGFMDWNFYFIFFASFSFLPRQCRPKGSLNSWVVKIVSWWNLFYDRLQGFCLTLSRLPTSRRRICEVVKVLQKEAKQLSNSFSIDGDLEAAA